MPKNRQSNQEILGSLPQGPRNKNAATLDLEKIVRAFLFQEKIPCRFNVLNELEVILDDTIYNLNFVLKYADFDHLYFKPEEIIQYETLTYQFQDLQFPKELVEKWKKASQKTFMSFYTFLTNLYDKRDKNHECDDLEFGEKLAISIYSGERNFIFINNLLRLKPPIKQTLNLSSTHLTSHIREILLTAVVAAHGLNKINNKKSPPLYRIEKTVSDLNAKRNPLHYLSMHGFVSTTTEKSQLTKIKKIDQISNQTIIEIDRNSYGKNIQSLTAFKEGEFLFIPNTNFLFFKKESKTNKTVFSAIPIRPVTDQILYNKELLHLRSSYLAVAKNLRSYEELKKTNVEYLQYWKHLISQDNDVQNNLDLMQVILDYSDKLIFLKISLDKDIRLIEAANFANNVFLSKEFKDKNIYPDDAQIEIKGVCITNRPNHNIVHSIRVAAYVKTVIQYFSLYAQNEYFKRFCKEISDDDIFLIKLALIFSVTGRESEVSFSKNPLLYNQYKKQSSENFINYAKSIDLIEEEFKEFAEALIHFGDPKYKPHDSSEKLHFICWILRMCHNLDLMRCLPKKEFISHLKIGNKNIAVACDEEEDFLKSLYKLATYMISVTGDRLMCALKDDDIADVKHPYDIVIFSKYSNFPSTCFMKCTEITLEDSDISSHIIEKKFNNKFFSFELFMLVTEKNFVVVEKIIPLLKAQGLDINNEFNYVTACIKNNDTKMLDIFLNHGANPNVFNGDNGLEPILLAAKKGYAKIIGMLIYHGANLNVVTKPGKNALHLAIENIHLEAATVLIKKAPQLISSAVIKIACEVGESTRNKFGNRWWTIVILLCLAVKDEFIISDNVINLLKTNKNLIAEILLEMQNKDQEFSARLEKIQNNFLLDLLIQDHQPSINLSM